MGPEPKAAGDDEDGGEGDTMDEDDDDSGLPRRRRRRSGVEGEEGDGDDGARWEDGDVKVAGEDEEEAAAKEGGAAAKEGAAGSGDAPAAAGSNELDAPHRGELPADSRRAELRHLVATLKEAIAFCRRLEGAMPALRGLLACPEGGVVTDVISLLTYCRWVQERFEWREVAR